MTLSPIEQAVWFGVSYVAAWICIVVLGTVGPFDRSFEDISDGGAILIIGATGAVIRGLLAWLVGV